LEGHYLIKNYLGERRNPQNPFGKKLWGNNSSWLMVGSGKQPGSNNKILRVRNNNPKNGAFPKPKRPPHGVYFKGALGRKMGLGGVLFRNYCGGGN